MPTLSGNKLQTCSILLFLWRFSLRAAQSSHFLACITDRRTLGLITQRVRPVKDLWRLDLGHLDLGDFGLGVTGVTARSEASGVFVRFNWVACRTLSLCRQQAAAICVAVHLSRQTDGSPPGKPFKPLRTRSLVSLPGPDQQLVTKSKGTTTSLQIHVRYK